MSNIKIENLDLDDVLAKFKVYGRYHLVASLYLSIGAVFETLWNCNYVFATEAVGYRCADDIFNTEGISSNNSDAIGIGIGDANNGTIDWCVNPSSCSKWIYYDHHSFVAEFDLACQDWKRTLVGSVHSFGYMIGLLIVGPLSDRFGRKTLIIVTGITGAVLGTAKTFVPTYWLYVALEFLESVFGDFCSPLFTLGLEMAPTKSRVTFTTIVNVGYGVGALMIALIAWLVPYWRYMLRVMYVPGLVSMAFLYSLDESPRWLLAKGKNTAAMNIIRKAAKINKIEINENLNLIAFEMEKESSFLTVLRDTFKSKSLMKRVAICVVWWISCTFVDHGLFLNAVSLQGNKFVNFALVSVVGILSFILGGCILAKFNRTGPLITTFVACAFLCIGQPFIPKSLIWLAISTYLAGCLMSSITFNTVYIFTSELFPTHTRNSMHALCSSIGRIGSILAPQTPLLMVYWTGLPTLIFGIVSLAAGLLTFLVPDTADRSLPDTVEQAEALEAETRTLVTCKNCCNVTCIKSDCTSL